MSDEERKAIELHTAGATVRHMSPFDHFTSFRHGLDLSQAFIDEWVIPYYMKLRRTDADWVQTLALAKNRITDDIIEKNLGDFNWRTRQTGAFFAAITNQRTFIDIVGTHLLKSEVCYAGAIYCVVLASFNEPACVDYLNQYLDYYLAHPECFFDQTQAMEAIRYLDGINGTRHFERHWPTGWRSRKTSLTGNAKFQPSTWRRCWE